MDKLTMAHEYAMKYVGNPDSRLRTISEVVDFGWAYADEMQAEADKRKKEEAEQKRKEMRELLNADNTFIEREGQHFDDVLNPSNSSQLDIQGILHNIDDYFDQAECTKTPRMANNLLAQIYEQLSGEVKTSEMEAERHG
ncbi:hypothetical protein ACFODO_20790 [Acinetobacter sichuanensis]|uniref:Uncharacterized protein n=1 Tax=Acinetobacter sichuanensis TaxID=2136183 RepID=A0A371YIP3_9GAMM|nr:hypothetical protein [Acinetobacter sichuanensis]RFC81347.1 hypothetical protein C9E89_022380 [Acinetobacter sichuanensis]